ncbi:MAG: DUF6056 family protein [Pelolinea sp.]|nr:DUF6056 family protein [Pelolinea sp.]
MTITKENQEKNIRKPFHSRIVLWVGSLFFLIPNLLFIVQGFSSRYWADDYCFSGLIKEYGFIDGLTTFYSTTSNRFSAFIFAGVSELFGRAAIRVIPVFVIVFLGYFLYRLITKILGLGPIDGSKNISFLLSQMILFFILYLSPNIDQSVYWRSGLTHYFLPFPILLFLLSIIFFNEKDRNSSVLRSLLVFLLACFNAGLSESYAALQLGLFGLLLFSKLILSKFKLRRIESLDLVLVLTGTTAAMVIMIMAPGNSLRLDSLQQAPHLFSIISIATSSAFNFIKFSIKGLWLPFGVLIGLSILIAYCFIRFSIIQYKQSLLVMAFILNAVTVFGLIVCVCAPTAYGMMAYPEQRVLMLAHIILVLGIFLEGVVIGLFFQKLFSQSQILRLVGLILIVVNLYPLSTIKKRITEINMYANRAALWDSRDSDIRSQIDSGKTDLIVNALDSFSEIAELNQNGKFWINQCAASYYGVASITAVESK